MLFIYNLPFQYLTVRKRVLLTHSLNNFPNQPEFAFLSKFSHFLQTEIEKYGKMKRQLCVLILAALGEAKKQKKERVAQEFFQCRAKQNCGDCIQTSPKCAWCEGKVIYDFLFLQKISVKIINQLFNFFRSKFLSQKRCLTTIVVKNNDYGLLFNRFKICVGLLRFEIFRVNLCG